MNVLKFCYAFTISLMFLCAVISGQIVEKCSLEQTGTIKSHPKICNGYLVCVNGQYIERNCAPNLLFNSKLKRCDRKNAVTCDQIVSTIPAPPPSSNHTSCPTVDPENYTVYLPHPNCSLYYICVSGKPILVTCPPGTHWSITNNWCDNVDYAYCIEGAAPTQVSPKITQQTTPSQFPIKITQHTTPKPTRKYLPPKTTKPTTPIPTVGPTRTMSPIKRPPNEISVTSSFPAPAWTQSAWIRPIQITPPIYNPTQVQPIITSTSTITPTYTNTYCNPLDPEDKIVYLPHPNCSKFYRCNQGYAHELLCPPGLHWGIMYEHCVFPEIANCIYGAAPTQPSAIERPIPTSTPPIHTHCPAVDPEDYTVHLPHPNCRIFYKCNRGHAYEIACPIGLHWSITYEHCVFPEIANCIYGAAPTQPSPIERPMPTLTQITHTHCPVVDPEDYTVHLPHPDCSTFYRCNRGDAHEIPCPSGLHWSITYQQCILPEIANCIYGTAPTQPSPTESSISTLTPTFHIHCPVVDPEDYTVHLPHSNCSLYYRCNRGQAHEIACPSSLHWSITYQQCALPEMANCAFGGMSTQSTAIERPRPTLPQTIHSHCPVVDPEDNTVHLPHSNCSKFYRCNRGQAYEIPCPSGLHWSITHQQCVLPEMANCTYGAAPTQPSPTETSIPTLTPTFHTHCPVVDPEDYTVHLPHSNCSIFYRCNRGHAHEIPCPSGLHWSITYQQCVLPEMANCAYGGMSTQATPIKRPIPTLTPTIHTHCPDVDPEDYTVHLPHPNCSVFYRCNRGHAHEIPCPFGLHWSITHQQCVLPEIANCIYGTAPAQTSPTGTLILILTPTFHTRCPTVDPEDYTVHLPHSNCSTFYRCSRGHAHEIPCPSGLHWSITYQHCVSPKMANCAYGAVPTQPSQIETPRPTLTPIIHTHCPAADPEDYTVHLPHQNCSAFYRCNRGHAYEISCTSGLHWSITYQQCVLPERANCTYGTAPTQTSPTETSETSHTHCPAVDPEDYTVHLPHSNCSLYYRCNRGHAHEISCPSGLHWSITYQQCVLPEMANCAYGGMSTQPTPVERPIPTLTQTIHTHCPAVDPEDYTVHLPHPNCSIFYRCNRGHAYEIPCPSGLHWSITHQQCVLPEMANCTYDTVPTQPSPTETSIPTLTPTFHTRCPVVDPEDYTVHLPHSNCSIFYRCSHGHAHEIPCQSGLHWSITYQQCVRPNMANCAYSGAPMQPSQIEIPIPTLTQTIHTHCPAVDPEHYTVHLSHPNCSIFYRCNRGHAYEIPCPFGLHWSITHQQCVLPEMANCTYGSAPTQPSPTEASIPTLNPTFHTHCPAVDPEDYIVHLPHSNCSTFYRCSRGHAHEIPCPSGLHWSITYQHCVLPEMANCAYGGAPTQPSLIGTPIPTLTPTIHTHCPVVDPVDYTVHLPHPTCSIFYRCNRGHAYEIPCPFGLHWSITHQQCVLPEMANCTYGSAPTQPSPLETTIPTLTPTIHTHCPVVDPEDYTVHLPHANCSVFYRCSRGHAHEIPCPSGLHWSITYQHCVSPKMANCAYRGAPTQPLPIERPIPTFTPTIHTHCPAIDPEDYTVHLPHSNCSMFYRCSRGHAREIPCPPGLQWSITYQHCVLPEMANCAYGGAPIQPSLIETSVATLTTIIHTHCPAVDLEDYTVHLPHPNCSIFYRCNRGHAYEIPCPSGLHWSITYQHCVYPEMANCTYDTAPTQPSPTETPIPTLTPTIHTHCPAVHPKGYVVHLPHPNCSMFYKCRKGQAYEMSCWRGLHWSNTHQRCVFPEVANCTYGTAPTQPPTVEAPIPTSTPTIHTHCPAADPEDYTVHLPHPNCSIFYRCSRGHAHEISCPPRLHWSITYQHCIFPEMANCEDGGAPTQPSPIETSIPTLTPTIHTHCPDVDPEHYTVHLPHPNCSIFYRCNRGQAHEIPCPSSLHWSITYQQCVFPEMANCIYGTAPTQTSPTDTPIPTLTPTIHTHCPVVDPKDHTVHLPHPNCSMFYKCREGQAYEMSCWRGLYWSNMHQRCVFPELANCTYGTAPTQPPPIETKISHTHCPAVDPEDYAVHLPHPNCTMFYKCVHGQANEVPCPPGLHWSIKYKQCDLPQTAKCVYDASHTQPPPIVERPTTAIHTHCPAIDPEDYTVHLPHPNCSMFYKCNNGQANEIPCQPGLHWSITYDRCDIPETANCTYGVAPTQPPAIGTPRPSLTPPQIHTYCPAVDPENYTVYLPHPNCSIFYKCAHGQAHEIPCQRGFHWSIAYDRCELPETADCTYGAAPTQPSPTETPTSPLSSPQIHTYCPAVDSQNYTVHLPHPNCTSFYKCANGQAHEISCPPGLHWSITYDRCEMPEMANCTHGVAPTQPPPIHQSCPTVDPEDYTVHLPHPNCSLFYKCAKGQAHEVQCPPTLHWSITYNRCDFRETANCTNGAAPAQTPSLIKPIVEPMGKPIVKPSTIFAPPVQVHCPLVDSAGYTIYLPHPNCSAYYKCAHGQPHEILCPPGLHWSVAYDRCDFPDVANCAYDVPPIIAESATILSSQPIHSSCPQIDPENHAVYLPHPNCTVFYKCTRGQAYEVSCPSGLHWSTAYNICHYPETANCTFDAALKQPPPNITLSLPANLPPLTNYTQCPEIDPIDRTVHLPHPNCNLFYKCDSGKPIEMACASDFHWSKTTGQCERRHTAKCINGDAPKQPIGAEEKCPFGLIWDREKLFCNFAELANKILSAV